MGLHLAQSLWLLKPENLSTTISFLLGAVLAEQVRSWLALRLWAPSEPPGG